MKLYSRLLFSGMLSVNEVVVYRSIDQKGREFRYLVVWGPFCTHGRMWRRLVSLLLLIVFSLSLYLSMHRL